MSQHDNPPNQRRAERKRASDAAIVTDVISGQPMGHLGNLSSSGMLLIGAQTPRSEALYQVSVALPDSIDRSAPATTIEVGIQEQWHEPASSGQVWAGYRIVAIGEEDVTRLDRWLTAP
ncbi:MAG: PilZ domain-containing protein [Rhodanobacter sp.]